MTPAAAAAAAAGSDVTRPVTQHLARLTTNTDDDAGSEHDASEQRETKPERIVDEPGCVPVCHRAHHRATAARRRHCTQQQ